IRAIFRYERHPPTSPVRCHPCRRAYRSRYSAAETGHYRAVAPPEAKRELPERAGFVVLPGGPTPTRSPASASPQTLRDQSAPPPSGNPAEYPPTASPTANLPP